MLSSQIIPLLFAAVFPACLLWAALSDAATMTIPNRLNILLAIGFFPFAFLMGLTPAQWGWHLGVGAIALVIGMGLFAVRALGGGDAKLLAASLLWLGKDAVLPYLLYTAIAGGALALLIVLSRKYLHVYAPALPKWLSRHLEARGDIPYGIALCAGGLLAVPFSPMGPLWQAITG